MLRIYKVKRRVLRILGLDKQFKSILTSIIGYTLVMVRNIVQRNKIERISKMRISVHGKARVGEKAEHTR